MTKYIKYKLDNDANLQEVYLKGEISNFKAHTRGHFYFTIKDEHSRINAIMFAREANQTKFTPEDGMKILIKGRISVYEATGNYQIYVSEMTEDGVGNLYIAFEQLKKKLETEGLFREDHKQKIPRIPKKVGVITASTGAAIRDIISTITRRFPLTEVILFPSLVQGDLAKDDIVRQIESASNYDLDVLIIGRGGGSIEDLWPFNEEIVAHAIYDCPIPIISAVGHEIDFTIADFVADLRAPTPTGAAEIAVPNQTDIRNYLKQLEIRFVKSVKNIFERKEQLLLELKNHYILKNPLDLYSAKTQKLDYLIERIINRYQNLLQQKTHQLALLRTHRFLKAPQSILEKYQQNYQLLLNKIDTLSPLKTLNRGYSIIKKKEVAIESIQYLQKNDVVEIILQDGSKEAIIK